MATTAPKESRNRDATEAVLVDAVGAILEREGLAGIGVNAVSRQAGVDKVLIYRYFDGLPGLLRAYGERSDFWWQVDDILPDPETPLAPALRQVFENSTTYLRHHPVTLSILAGEMSERNALTEALEYVREERSLALMRELLSRYDLEARNMMRHIGPVMTVLGAAASYLAVRSRDIRTYVGVDIRSDRGWSQISDTVELMLKGILSEAEAG